MNNEMLIKKYKKDLKSDLIKNSREQFLKDKTYEDFAILVEDLDNHLSTKEFSFLFRNFSYNNQSILQS